MASIKPQLRGSVLQAALDSQEEKDEVLVNDGVVINAASGHVQEVERNFSLLSLAAMGIVTGCQWPALGGSVLVAIYNGGPPGVIYEFMAATLAYIFVFISIAELASALPTSAGVYHWASIGAGPRWGKLCGFLAGYWNFFAWLMGAASFASIIGNILVSMYALFHPYEFHRWHVFIVYLIVCWICCLTVAFANRALPSINNIGMVFIVIGAVITIVVCAVVPGTSGNGYATAASVWSIWQNGTGYASNGFVFLLGMLNGVFTVGAPDIVTHMCEEIPNPRKNVPLAMLAQMATGFITAFGYIIALFFSISDFDAVTSADIPFPVAVIYQQATNSRGGALGLLILILIPSVCTLVGLFITMGRMLWTLGRDDATPFSKFVGKVDQRSRNPINATLICGVLVTVLGLIYLGSIVAFNAFVGSFAVLSSVSYLAAILSNLLSRRRYISYGPFHLPKVWSYLVAGIASTYITVFIVIFCFPFSLPVTAESMNYASAMTGGLTVLVSLWYIYKRKNGYAGPAIMRPDGPLAAAIEMKYEAA